MSFGEKLQKLRKEKKMSQEQLADQLNISRQAVSKWESDQTYPEMDKLIALTKIFDCSMDDLVQKEKDVSMKSEKEENKKSILLNPLEELFDLINRSYAMLCKMRFRDFICFALEMLFVFLVLLFLSNAIGIIVNLADDIFYCFGSGIGDFLSNVFRFILIISYAVLSLTVLVYIYKIRYLDYYESIEEKDSRKVRVDENHNSKQDEIIVRKIVEVPRRTSKLGIYVKKILLLFLKACTFCCGIPFLFSILFFSFALAISITLFFKGVFYFGVFFGLIFLILLNIVIIEIICDFLFDHPLSKKRAFYSFLIGMIGLGLSSGIFTLELASTNYLDTVEDPVVTEKEEFMMTPDLKLYLGYHSFSFVDNGDSSKVTVEVKYHKDFSNVSILQHENFIQVYKYSDDNPFNKKFLSIVLNDLKKKELQDYSLLYDCEIIISTSEQNYNIISNNIREEEDNSYYNYYRNEMNRYQERIEDLEEELSLKEENFIELREQKEELEREKNLIQEKMNKIKEQLDSLKELIGE